MPVYDEKFDLNKDGKIDDADFALFKSVYRQAASASRLASAADFNNDGTVDIGDWGEFAIHLGAVGSPPKPNISWGWIVLGVLALVLWRKK